MTRPTRYSQEDIDRYARDGRWELTTMSHVWDSNAGKYPGKEAITDTRTALTWADASRWIDRIALGFLERGIDRDEAVVVQLPNSLELHLLRLACEKAGLLCVPLLSNMRESELKYVLNYTRAAALVIPQRHRGFDYVDMVRKIRPETPTLKHIVIAGDKAPEEAVSLEAILEQLPEEKAPNNRLENRRYRPEEVSMVCLTSGSTGFPKLAEYPAATSPTVGQHFTDILKLTDRDTVAAISPASRGPNLPAYFAAPWAAARIVMVPWTGAREALRTIERKGITVACLVPAQLTMMLQKATAQHYDLSSVRLWYSTGAPLPVSIAEAVERIMGGTILNGYGAVDFGVMAVPLPEAPPSVRLSTAGKPRFGNRTRIVDDHGKEANKGEVGEITGQGPGCSSGYYKDPEATRQAWNRDGWYATGDLGRFDEEGNLIIVGRKKDVIIRGGQNIYPSEIESLLTTYPKIENVAIVAMPDPVMGEKACAYVVPTQEELLTFEEMVSFLKEKKIARFKIPERLEIVDRFPMVSDGQKIDKKRLEQDLAQKLKSEEMGE